MGIQPLTVTQIAIATSDSQLGGPRDDTAYDEARWYAVYTCANHEKRIATQFNERVIENFLPLYQTVRRWKDRRMTIDVPLFPGYIFVRHCLRDQLSLLTVPGVVRLVGFNNVAAQLPAEDIEALRSGLNRASGAEPHPYLTVGRRVQIVHGPFEGLRGILSRRKGRARVVISIDLIERSLAVDVDVADVAPLP
jgi:transcription antitermination factor NusG